jgi:hypothetical protein
MSDPSLNGVSPVPIICAYDDVVAAIWGEALRRPWPHPKDKVIAERWITAGATLDMCRLVFRDVLEKRHARGLTIPFSLSYFENMIRDAITTERNRRRMIRIRLGGGHGFRDGNETRRCGAKKCGVRRLARLGAECHG